MILYRDHGAYRLRVGRFAYVTVGDTIFFVSGYQPAQICQTLLEPRPPEGIPPSAKRVRVEGKVRVANNSPRNGG